MAYNPFADFTARYYDDPCAFSQNVLGLTPDPNQAVLLNDIVDPKHPLISVRSGHGTGKSTGLAIASVHCAITRYRFKVIQTAPTSAQLFDALYSETAAMFSRLPAALRPLFTVKADRIVLNSSPKDCFISARTSSKDKPEALAGVHSDFVLLLIDEASGVPPEVFESAQGSMSTENATTVMTGNPTRTSGLFFESHHILSDLWKTHHWSSLDSPRVTHQFIEQIRTTYGEGSNQWKVRVLGDFPETDDESLISRISVQKAMERDIEPDYEGGVVIWGVDPARYGMDRTGFCCRVGNVFPWIEHKSNLNVMACAGWIKSKYDQCNILERPQEILVDIIGIGSGVVDRLTELNLPVTGVNVAEASLAFSDGYKLRDYLWLELKKWLEGGKGRLPKDKMLEEEIVSPSYDFVSNGKIKVESKRAMKRRGLRSPDLADAIILTFASEPAILIGGETRNLWNQKIERKVPMYG